MDLLTLQMAKNYTDDTVEGMGIQKGKNCQIQNIEDITGGHRITFAWYDEDQVLQTDTVDIMNGPEGPEGPQGPQGEVGESGVGFGPVPEVMPEGVNWWVDPNGEPNTAATINDANVSEDETWSSKKISGEIDDSIGTQLFDGIEEAGGINTSTGEDDDTATNNRRIPKSHAIHVVPGATYYLTKSGGKIRFTFYEEDGTYVGNTDALGNSLMDTAVTAQKMVPPAGAYLFRVYSSASIVSHDFCCNSGVIAKMDLMQEDINEINDKLDNLPKPVLFSSTEKIIGETDVTGGKRSIYMRNALYNENGRQVDLSSWGIYRVLAIIPVSWGSSTYKIDDSVSINSSTWQLTANTSMFYQVVSVIYMKS